MLSRPEDGWTYFQPGKENRYRLSYLTDVAVDWLTQAIHGLETMDVFSVHGFSEPGRMVCTVSYWSCYVIFEDDGPAPVCEDITHLHINMIEFCKRLCRDIEELRRLGALGRRQSRGGRRRGGPGPGGKAPRAARRAQAARRRERGLLHRRLLLLSGRAKTTVRHIKGDRRRWTATG